MQQRKTHCLIIEYFVHPVSYHFSVVDSPRERIDRVLSERMPHESRSVIQKSIKSGNLKINTKVVLDSSFKVSNADEIDFSLAPVAEQTELEPNDQIPLDIVYEDDDLIVINKQSNLTVHPGVGAYQDTLVNALLFHCKELSSAHPLNLSRPGIVHRLDKDTSGLMIIAKNNYAHNDLASQIASRTLIRKYQAIVWGILNPKSGTITTHIGRSKLDRTKMQVLSSGGKIAITHYKTMQILYGGILSLIECKLETGRTHQIRVHLSHIGHSILGDQTYGHNKRKLSQCRDEALRNKLSKLTRQALHSCYIKFTHPKTKLPMEFNSAIPDFI